MLQIENITIEGPDLSGKTTLIITYTNRQIIDGIFKIGR